MKVWVLMGLIAYEGYYLIGVFSSKEKAEHACDGHSASDISYDDYEITVEEIDNYDDAR